MPSVFTKDEKITELERDNAALLLRIKDIRHEAAELRLLDRQRIDVLNDIIKAQRTFLEQHYETQGCDRRISQFRSSVISQQYDRASKVLSSEGPYATPEKEKPPRES